MFNHDEFFRTAFREAIEFFNEPMRNHRFQSSENSRRVPSQHRPSDPVRIRHNGWQKNSSGVNHASPSRSGVHTGRLAREGIVPITGEGNISKGRRQMAIERGNPMRRQTSRASDKCGSGQDKQRDKGVSTKGRDREETAVVPLPPITNTNKSMGSNTTPLPDLTSPSSQNLTVTTSVKSQEMDDRDRRESLRLDLIEMGHNDDITDGVLRDLVVSDDQKITFDDIAGMDDAKRLLHEAVVLPLIVPEVFSGIRKPWKG